MKRRIALILGMILALSLTACGAAPAAPAETEAQVQLANPYGTYETAAQMQEAAGLDVSLPETLPDWVNETIYRAIPGELVEVIYTDGDNEIRVRIKNGSEDISGVYDADTKEVKDITVGEKTVHVKGEAQENGEFLIYVCTWNTSEGRTYSVTSRNGVPEETMVPVLEQVR